MSNRPVRLVREGSLAVLILDSPPLNLFSQEVFRSLVEGIDEVADSDARALVWRAEGDLFSGGADVNDFNRVVEEGGAHQSFGSLLIAAHKLEQLPIPTLALVHGLCLTAGLETSLACDMIWADESAKFGLVEAVVGLTPGAGGTQRIAERAGPARAAEFVMSGGLYDAATMERWNVVNRVLRGGPGDPRAVRRALRIRGPPGGGEDLPRGGAREGDLQGSVGAPASCSCSLGTASAGTGRYPARSHGEGREDRDGGRDHRGPSEHDVQGEARQ